MKDEAAAQERHEREAATQRKAQQDQAAWDIANSIATEVSYQDYLKSWPSGKYASLVKARLHKLQTDFAVRQEHELWQKADAGESIQTVQTYLDKYPSGSYVTAAREKIASIRKAEASGPAMVRIPDSLFEIGKYVVTQKQWREVMGSNPSRFSSCGDNCPVEQISWNDAQEFIQKLNAKTGKQYRLPTDDEWVRACYGGSETKYCGGDDINAMGWHPGNSGGITHPVGQKQANGYGLYDMSGNVREWIQDQWDNKHNWRVLRGGSWDFKAESHRLGDDPATRSSNYGFRLARTLP